MPSTILRRPSIRCVDIIDGIADAFNYIADAFDHIADAFNHIADALNHIADAFNHIADAIEHIAEMVDGPQRPNYDVSRASIVISALSSFEIGQFFFASFAAVMNCSSDAPGIFASTSR